MDPENMHYLITYGTSPVQLCETLEEAKQWLRENEVDEPYDLYEVNIKKIE